MAKVSKRKITVAQVQKVRDEMKKGKGSGDVILYTILDENGKDYIRVQDYRKEKTVTIHEGSVSYQYVENEDGQGEKDYCGSDSEDP